MSREEDDAVALVRVYCGLASADPAEPQSGSEIWLTVAVVDDAGRLIDICEVSDDAGGYAELSALLAQRSGGQSAVAVAAESDDHVVTQLLTAAGRNLAFTDDDSADDYAERFADDESPEEIQSNAAERRAVGLARALQAGVLSAVGQSPPRDMLTLKPVLAAHTAVVAGRQSAAATLREVLRELYPAALRAYPDPAEAIPLAILDALPEPGILGGGAAGRNRDAQVVAELATTGVSDANTLGEAITALRVAIAETPRRTGVNRALTAAVAETIRQSVAAVRACDAAAASLVGVLADKMSPTVNRAQAGRQRPTTPLTAATPLRPAGVADATPARPRIAAAANEAAPTRSRAAAATNEAAQTRTRAASRAAEAARAEESAASRAVGGRRRAQTAPTQAPPPVVSAPPAASTSPVKSGPPSTSPVVSTPPGYTPAAASFEQSGPAYGQVPSAPPAYGQVTSSPPAYGQVTSAPPSFGQMTSAPPAYGQVTSSPPAYGQVTSAPPVTSTPPGYTPPGYTAPPPYQPSAYSPPTPTYAPAPPIPPTYQQQPPVPASMQSIPVPLQPAPPQPVPVAPLPVAPAPVAPPPVAPAPVIPPPPSAAGDSQFASLMPPPPPGIAPLVGGPEPADSPRYDTFGYDPFAPTASSGRPTSAPPVPSSAPPAAGLDSGAMRLSDLSSLGEPPTLDVAATPAPASRVNWPLGGTETTDKSFAFSADPLANDLSSLPRLSDIPKPPDFEELATPARSDVGRRAFPDNAETSRSGEFPTLNESSRGELSDLNRSELSRSERSELLSRSELSRSDVTRSETRSERNRGDRTELPTRAESRRAGHSRAEATDQADLTRDNLTRDDLARSEPSRSERARTEIPRSERSRTEIPRSERSRTEIPRSERSRAERPAEDPAGRPAERSADRPLDRTVERPVELPRQREGRVPPPWQTGDLPAEPAGLRLVEPAPVPDPALRAGSYADELSTDYSGEFRFEPPALRLVEADRPAERATARSSGSGAGRSRRAAAERAEAAKPADEGDGDLLIFAAARSAWFTDWDADSSSESETPVERPAVNWENSNDVAWQAAQRASAPEIADNTHSGLPRRVPQQNLVPGAPVNSPERPLRIVRDAAQIAAHTTGYFRGWRRGQEVGGFAVGGRPGRESAGGWDFSREASRDYQEREYEYRSAHR